MWQNGLRGWLEQHGERRELSVRWLLNPDESPRCNVRLVEEHGVITDIRTVSAGQESACLPLLVVPPLVNAHTHLEFSSLETPLAPGQPFADWIRTVIGWRRAQVGDPELVIHEGMRQSLECGVGLLGEIATRSGVYSDDIPASVVFREVIGLTPERIREQLAAAQEHVALYQAQGTSGSACGLSPHAPYTVHPELMQSLMALAIEHRLPVAMHLAETREELQLLERGDGSLAEFLKSMGLFDSSVFPGGRRPMEFLQALADVPRALAVHGNYFGREEIEFLGEHPNISVVYCPRTHAWFGHSEHPFRRMQGVGIRVVLGTDSRASNPDLSILSELQYVLRQHRELQVSRQLKMITTEAAEALGRPECSAPLRVGSAFSASMIVCGDNQSNVDATIRDRGTYPLLLAGQRPCDPSELKRLTEGAVR